MARAVHTSGSVKRRLESNMIHLLALLLVSVALITTSSAAEAQDCSTAGTGTVLARAAAGLAAGSWCKLTPQPTNMPSVLHATGASGYIFGYAHSGAWDSTQKRIYFAGGDHGCNVSDPTNCTKFVYYDDATNSWAVQAAFPSGDITTICGAGACHGYDYQSVIPGVAYIGNIADSLGVGGSRRFSRYDFASNTWTRLPSVQFGYAGCCNSITYFPDRHSLVTGMNNSGSAGSVWEFNLSTNTWSNYGTVNPAPLFGDYNPVYNYVLLYATADSGRSKLWKLAANGSLTQLSTAVPDPPVRSPNSSPCR